MRLRATCQLCLRDFQLSEIYNATRHGLEQCPSCGAHLGVRNLDVILRRIDVTMSVLLAELSELEQRSPVFDIDLRPLVRALDRRPAERHAPRATRRRRREAA